MHSKKIIGGANIALNKNRGNYKIIKSLIGWWSKLRWFRLSGIFVLKN